MARRKKDTSEKQNQVFATRFRALIESSDKTQAEVAEAIGKSRQAISQYYHGESEPTFDTLAKIAHFFGVSSDYLIGLTETRSTEVSVREIVKATGLSEENITFLINPPEYFWDDPVSKYKESLYALANILVGFCKKQSITELFQNIYILQGGISAPADDPDPLGSGVSRTAQSRGYAVLPINESIAFRASQIAKTIEQEIAERYKMEERNAPIGKPHSTTIGGNEVVEYRE